MVLICVSGSVLILFMRKDDLLGRFFFGESC